MRTIIRQCRVCNGAVEPGQQTLCRKASCQRTAEKQRYRRYHIRRKTGPNPVNPELKKKWDHGFYERHKAKIARALIQEMRQRSVS